LTADQIRITGEHIAGQQLASGLIPWFRGHHGDPWDHIEAAMALTVCGLDDAARLAFEWSATHQSPDGSWPMETTDSYIGDERIDTNQCAYLAVGVWHSWLITRDRAQVEVMWPVVRRAIELVVALQLPFGGIAWSRNEAGEVSQSALLTGSRTGSSAPRGWRTRWRCTLTLFWTRAGSRWTGTTLCSAESCGARPDVRI
jgi:hypothetical protein